MSDATQPTFVCASRWAVLRALVPRLTALDSGTLCGQRNCHIVLGSHGVGKSWFVRSLVRVVALMARPTTCVIHVNFQTEGVREPLHLLQEAFAAAGGLALPPVLRAPAASFSELLDFMREHSRRAFLVIDGVEGLYRRPRDCPIADRVYRQLHTMGELDGASRPVVAVLTGSAAVLRTLLYAVPGFDLASVYPSHLRWGSLNDRKYPASTLWPVTGPGDVAHAVLCISSGSPALPALVASGRLVPRAGVGAAGPAAAGDTHEGRSCGRCGQLDSCGHSERWRSRQRCRSAVLCVSAVSCVGYCALQRPRLRHRWCLPMR